MRGAQSFSTYFPGWLWTLGLLAIDIDAPLPGASASHGIGIETAWGSQASFDDNVWSTAAPADGRRARFPFSDNASSDPSYLRDGTFLSASGDTHLVAPKGFVLETRVTTPAPPPTNSKDRHLLLRASLGTAILVFGVCLGLITLRPEYVLPAPHAARSSQALRQQQRQNAEDGATEQLQQLHELNKLQPLVAHLAQMVGTDVTLSASQEFLASVQRLHDIDQIALGDSRDPSGPPLIPAKKAVEDSISALSKVYEAAREHGLSLVQEARKQRLQYFSEEELQALEDSLGREMREIMDLSERNFKTSFAVLMRQAEKAAKELEELRGIDSTEDVHLLVAVATSLEMLKIAHDAVQVQSVCFDDIRANATEMLQMQYQREQIYKHRELEEQLAELRILCTLDRERQQVLPQQDIGVLEAMDWLEIQLNRGDQQLQKHKEVIDWIEEADDILSLSNAQKRARSLADSLKGVLKMATCSRRSIPGFVRNEEAARSESMQRHLKLVALKASREAEDAAERAASILSALNTQTPGDSGFPWTKGEEGRQQRPPLTLVTTNATRLMLAALEQVEDARADLRRAGDEKGDMQEKSSTSDTRGEKVLHASRTAAMAVGEIIHEVELIWLRAQLYNNLKLDMQLSVTLTKRATSTVGRETKGEDQQQQWYVEMSPSDFRELDNLLAQFKNGEDAANSATDLKELASAAAVMKQAALELTSFVEERQKQPAKR